MQVDLSRPPREVLHFAMCSGRYRGLPLLGRCTLVAPCFVVGTRSFLLPLLFSPPIEPGPVNSDKVVPNPRCHYGFVLVVLFFGSKMFGLVGGSCVHGRPKKCVSRRRSVGVLTSIPQAEGTVRCKHRSLSFFFVRRIRCSFVVVVFVVVVIFQELLDRKQGPPARRAHQSRVLLDRPRHDESAHAVVVDQVGQLLACRIRDLEPASG